MITNVKEILTKAKEGGYAVGAFNAMNLETTRAIVEGALEMRSPVIIQVTEKTMEYGGGRGMYHLIKNDAEFYAPDIPIGMHIDHGKSFEVIQRAANIGYPSVMYDGSRNKYADNLMVTKKVVDFCHEKGVDVQGELGSVPYLGEIQIEDIDWDKYMTDPGQAEEFVKKTGIDALAVAIGNAHGFFKERKEPDYARLEMINKNIGNIPIILHGASDWENGRVQEVIKRGIACFNIDTALRLAFINNLASAVKNKSEMSYDPRNILGDARDAVKAVVKEKIKIFGSDGKA
ncbi:fructose-bisphosphate aldolase [bacterium BMS3Abin15]|nr:fructose-bisphosphate aldolase [bacterium BMS3Abin15]HDH07406.1 class II fructose-bisphosphate aldolase [Candidatus Moranbacteria bacterium]HDZ85970.1 class II fructose-bisphosphate aldolase [Candidatus Moranbacteria bacterium]